MVRLHVKRGEENLFIYETLVTEKVEDVLRGVLPIFNGRLKVGRICMEMEELVKHGVMNCPEVVQLTDEQVSELNIVDPWIEKCIPSGGFQSNPDPIRRRCGSQPLPEMQKVLESAMRDAKELISKKLLESGKCLTLKNVQEALDILRGAVMIVYPMELPPHDPIRMELNNTEDLSGTQASLEVIEPTKAQLWFAGRQMIPEDKLNVYFGNNEKCKVIVKLGKSGEGQPGREPAISEETRRELMLKAYRRQEELKKLEQDDDDEYLNSSWADSGSLKRQVHGLDNIKFNFGKK
ncbi:cilia- and flagella-associated protein 298 isoform X2 [Phlebotomus argentipes]|uniref:cilia- and flagella-associated protein 298 isoform X2 n=1 Tax=Phlebotomus argentipes TaxID=94469 RepID=UPI002892BB3F|nr:cilia- and flagella-associated protein 298 isoform X2 [Phlebotomus argentipes]